VINIRRPKYFSSNYYSRQSVTHFTVSWLLWRLGQLGLDLESGLELVEGMELREKKMRNLRWLSWQHQHLADTYLGYAVDWVALSEYVPRTEEGSFVVRARVGLNIKRWNRWATRERN
jgi:hypothetical protein